MGKKKSTSLEETEGGEGDTKGEKKTHRFLDGEHGAAVGVR